MSRKKKKLCFVLMPFKDDMKEVYEKAIKPACEDAGFRSLRMDELIAQGSYNINKKIIHNIFVSNAIVADLTTWNPNVFYEMGIAHTIANKTVMIINKKDKPPFDVGGYHCIQYEQTETDLEKLKLIITQNLKRIDDWCKEPTNPVQEFQPFNALVPRSDLLKMNKELADKEKLFAQSIPRSEHDSLKKELTQLKNELNRRPESNEVKTLNDQLKQLHSQLAEKEETEKRLQNEIQRVRVKLDEADKKKQSDQSEMITPEGMVFIPAGEFMMGTNDEQIEIYLKDHPDRKREWFEPERPSHCIWIDSFLIDKYLVTNAQFAEFLNEWGDTKEENGQLLIEASREGISKSKTIWKPRKGRENNPIVYVTWFGAQKYAKWANKQLPTEAQWEKAARGNLDLEFATPDGIINHTLANYGKKLNKTTEVGKYPPNPYGLCDMSGNAWEWCLDKYDKNYYKLTPQKNPLGPDIGNHRVLRGGAWRYTTLFLRNAYRNHNYPDNKGAHISFRCVKLI